MRSFNRLIWLFMLLCVAMLAITSSVRCLTEDKPSDISEEMFDGDLLESLDYEGLDESENEAPVKAEYGSQSAPPPPPPQQQAYYPPPPPPPPPSYSQPQLPPPSYSPPPPPPAYSPPQQNYVQPQYNPVPLPNYTISNEYVTSTYLAVEPQVYPQQVSTADTYQAPLPPPQPVYESLVPAYQPATAPVASNYSYQQPQPVYEQVSYQQAAPLQQVSSYQAVPVQQQTYQQPQPVHQQISYQQPATYQPQQAPAYQPQQTTVYQTPQQAYQQKPVVAPAVANYSQPQPQQQQQATSYQPALPPQITYQKPQPVVVLPPPVYQPAPVVYQKPVQQNYSGAQVASYKPPVQQAVVPTVYKQPMQQYLPALIQKYTAAELAPFLTPYNYRSNHWSLFYYRGAQNPYFQRQCPRSPYTHGPSYKDIEAAFIEALAQLGQYRQPNYSNLPYPSASARHQIFSLLSQQPARMDEEGLLVEMASRYLADRLCLTKWDKQRYLPQLTKFISSSQFPATHSCSNYYRNPWQGQAKQCYNSKYRTFDGFCNNPYHPYWGKANVCHIRLLSPDYADGISLPRVSINSRYPLPNPRQVSNTIHTDVPIDGPYNLMKMQWGQFINHDITNTALSAYDGLVDCCKQPQTRGCWPIYVPPGDRFYGPLNVTCLNFIRSGVCPLCQLGPRQQSNKNSAFLDASHVYGNSREQAMKLRSFVGGQLRTSSNRLGEQLLPVASSQEQCFGTCYLAGDSRVNQHPALTALHVLLLRNHNIHAQRLAQRHPNWSDEVLFQEARRINIAEYQMITYNEYLPIVFGPILSAYYQLIPKRAGNTYYNYHVDPTTWNEYATATCRFGHSQIQSYFGLYSRILGYGQVDSNQPTFRLKDWFMRPSLITDGQIIPLMNGLLARQASVVDPWLTNDVRNHLYQSHREHSGGDLAATNIWRGRDHGIPGYVHYIEYCFNHKVRGWKDLALFIPPFALNQLRRIYRVVENVDLWSGGIAERHFPGADIGPTFACVNGIQYYHLKFGDRYYFEHGGQAGSFTPPQLDEIRRATLARVLCRTAYLPSAPQYAFMAPSLYNPLVNCTQIAEFNYGAF